MTTQIDFKTRHRTAWILGVIAAVLIGWDIYAAFFTRGDGDTISEILLELAKRRPVIVFAFGVVCGHCFWPQIERRDSVTSSSQGLKSSGNKV